VSRGQLYSELSKLDVKTIFDIGACDFGDSIKLKKEFPNADVYAVEADPINYFRNYSQAETYGIKTFNFGMSDTTGKATFYPSLYEKQQNIDWGYAGSLVKPLLKPDTNEALNHTVIYHTEGIQIPTKRFDEFCEEINVVRIELLFIDVEGAEYKVMSSLGDIRPKLIFAETHHYQVKNFENEIDLNQFDELMFSLGYEIVDRLQYDTLYRHK
jgi:FkbM family methyltransferase